MLDMQPAFIRRLDTEGVVCPARSVGGQRRYSRVELDHIAALAALMGEGMTLVGAQRIIELENEVADLRQQLAAQASGRTRPRSRNAESQSGPGTVVDTQVADPETL
jgi:MerR family transcriptional regulator/heat shock protein HspR